MPKLSAARIDVIASELIAWIGPEDYDRSHTTWVEKIILNFPDAVLPTIDKQKQMIERGLLTLHPNTLRDDGRPPGTDHKIRWLMAAIAREAGVKSWSEVPTGVFPRQ